MTVPSRGDGVGVLRSAPGVTWGDGATGELGLLECTLGGLRLLGGAERRGFPFRLWGLRSCAKFGSNALKSNVASESSLGTCMSRAVSSESSSTTIPPAARNHSLAVFASFSVKASITSAFNFDVDKSRTEASLESRDRN